MFFLTQMATQRHFNPLRAEVTKNTATSQLWYVNSTPMSKTRFEGRSPLGFQWRARALDLFPALERAKKGFAQAGSCRRWRGLAAGILARVWLVY